MHKFAGANFLLCVEIDRGTRACKGDATGPEKVAMGSVSYRDDAIIRGGWCGGCSGQLSCGLNMLPAFFESRLSTTDYHFIELTQVLI